MTQDFLNEVKAFYQSVKAASEKSFNWTAVWDESAKRTIQGVEVHIEYRRPCLSPRGNVIPSWCHIGFMWSDDEEKERELTPMAIQQVNEYCEA